MKNKESVLLLLTGFFFLAKYKQVCCKGPGMTCSGEGSKSVKYSIKNYKRSIDTLIKVLLYLLNGLLVILTHSGIYEYFTDGFPDPGLQLSDKELNTASEYFTDS